MMDGPVPSMSSDNNRCGLPGSPGAPGVLVARPSARRATWADELGARQPRTRSSCPRTPGRSARPGQAGTQLPWQVTPSPASKQLQGANCGFNVWVTVDGSTSCGDLAGAVRQRPRRAEDESQDQLGLPHHHSLGRAADARNQPTAHRAPWTSWFPVTLFSARHQHPHHTGSRRGNGAPHSVVRRLPRRTRARRGTIGASSGAGERRARRSSVFV